MADDTTIAGGGESKTGGAGVFADIGATGAPEPVILEERVIPKAAQAKPAPPSVPPQTTDETPTVLPQATTPDEPATQETMPPGKIQRTDVARALASAKLPERRLEPTASTTPPALKQYDTSVTSLLDTAPDATLAPRAIEHAAPTPEHTTVVPLHTLKDDLQHVVREQKISVVRAVSLEEERRHRAKKDDSFEPLPAAQQRGRRVLNILFSAALLLALGGAALLGVYVVARNQNAGAAPPSMQSLLFAESAIVLPLSARTPTDLRSALGALRANAGGTLGSIIRIVPVIVDAQDDTKWTRLATFSEFVRALDPHVPDELLRATGDDFFLGIHTNVDRNAPVLVVRITSYDRAFAGMLAWEAGMNEAFAPFYTPLPAQTVSQDELPVARTFQDVIMRNYDTRALKDDAGNVQFYYSFPNRDILIIAESPYSFTEVLSRLQAERLL